MDKNNFSHKLFKKTARYVAFASCFFLACVITTDPPPAPLTIERVFPLGDTIAPFGKVAIAFSTPLKDSILSITVSPQVAGNYSTYLNVTKDTFFIDFSDMLPGLTRYCLRFKNEISASTGVTLLPNADSIVFVTGAVCSGQNITQKTADTLVGKTFGTISLAGDTLYFVIKKLQTRQMYISSPDGLCGISMVDVLGQTLSSSKAVSLAETLSVPDFLVAPLTAKIYPLIGSAMVRFECGILP